ncbi:DUF2225 domain-containing protein [Heliobacterium chlorum]|uniref:DUF2225 domain-containing protein n=1 Tax=Heliobacterium chlorum TaxID=2698 RepID=A0ABR7SXD2_HELCL|nr:DUF2225 domain-containing protein [Heliobacterium chlorum]MBC9783215.1 DUF2225 domain-containing protein [Heliobacterium chlorum]
MIAIGQLAQSGTLKNYEADDIIVHEGEPGNEMYIILSGKVEVYIQSIDGFPIVITELQAGDFFGEMSLLEGLPRSASVRAIENTILLSISESNFESIMSRQPRLAFKVMKGLSARLRQLNEELRRLKEGRRPQAKEISKLLASRMAAAGFSVPANKGADPSREKASSPSGPPAVEPVSPFSSAKSTGSPSVSSDRSVQASAPETSLFDYAPGHKSYGKTAPAGDDDYLYDKKVTCPVCDGNFETKAVRSSKPKLHRVDPDFRQHFHDFEPLWYTIWVCPHCYFSTFNFEFTTNLPGVIIKQIKTELAKLPKPFSFQYDHPRKIDQVFMAYYLALYTAKAGKPDPSKTAKLWMRLCWLYDDMGDKEIANYASYQALEQFKDTYFNSNRNTSIDQEQRLSILLGELSLRHHEYKEAMKFFRGGIARRGGSPSLNRQASNRYQDMKEIMEKEKESESEKT